MREKDAAKIVAATAAASALFAGLVVFRVVKGLVLVGKIALSGQHHAENSISKKEELAEN